MHSCALSNTGVYGRQDTCTSGAMCMDVWTWTAMSEEHVDTLTSQAESTQDAWDGEVGVHDWQQCGPLYRR